MKPILNLKNDTEFKMFSRMLKSKYSQVIYICSPNGVHMDRAGIALNMLRKVFKNLPNVIDLNGFTSLPKKAQQKWVDDIKRLINKGEKIILLDFLYPIYTQAPAFDELNCKHLRSRYLTNLSDLIIYTYSEWEIDYVNIALDKHDTLNKTDNTISKLKSNSIPINTKIDNKSERILCAAILYDNNVVYNQKPFNINTGLVVCGLRHCNCFSILSQIFPFRDYKNNMVQGFITNHNRFLDRKDALVVAKKAKQIIKKHDPKDRLDSSDLY